MTLINAIKPNVEKKPYSKDRRNIIVYYQLPRFEECKKQVRNIE